MLDLRVILGLHFHNLGPGRSCTEAKHLVQTKIEQTAPETNSISRFTPLVPGMTNFLSESLKKPSLCACQAAGFPDRKEGHFGISTQKPFTSSAMFHSQCCKSRAFNSSGVWVTSFDSFPDLRKMEFWQLFHVNLTEVTAPSASLEAFQTGHLPKKRQCGNGKWC